MSEVDFGETIQWCWFDKKKIQWY